MNDSDLKTLYAQCEQMSLNELQELCEKDFTNKVDATCHISTVGAIGGAAMEPVIGGIMGRSIDYWFDNQRISSFDELKRVCIKEIKKQSSKIRKLIHDNPKVSNYTLEVIQLVAPAIAQQYTGLSGMVIVGSPTIICKQGLVV